MTSFFYLQYQSTFCMCWVRALGLTWSCHTRARAGWAEGGHAQCSPSTCWGVSDWACSSKWLGSPQLEHVQAHDWVGPIGYAQAETWASSRGWTVLGLAQAVPTSLCVGRTWANPAATRPYVSYANQRRGLAQLLPMQGSWACPCRARLGSTRGHCWRGCLGVLHIVEENQWDIWNPEEILCQKHMLFMQKHWFETLTFLNFYLTSVKSKFWWRHIIKWPLQSISTCNHYDNYVPYGMFVTFVF